MTKAIRQLHFFSLAVNADKLGNIRSLAALTESPLTPLSIVDTLPLRAHKQIISVESILAVPHSRNSLSK